MVPVLVILTVVVFIIVDLILRNLLKAAEHRKIQKKRKEALDIGLRLDFTEEAPHFKMCGGGQSEGENFGRR